MSSEMITREMLLKCFGIFKTKDGFRTARKSTVIGSVMPTIMPVAFLDGFEASIEVFAVVFSAFKDFSSTKSSEFLRQRNGQLPRAQVVYS
jgi:uncharacterized protein (DUF934 family)